MCSAIRHFISILMDFRDFSKTIDLGISEIKSLLQKGSIHLFCMMTFYISHYSHCPVSHALNYPILEEVITELYKCQQQ